MKEFIMCNSLNNDLEVKIVNILFEIKYVILRIKGDFYLCFFCFFEYEKQKLIIPIKEKQLHKGKKH